MSPAPSSGHCARGLLRQRVRASRSGHAARARHALARDRNNSIHRGMTLKCRPIARFTIAKAMLLCEGYARRA